MLTGFIANEHDAIVAEGVCDTCGRHYTVIPIPQPDRWRAWADCLRPDCGSYDITRDADIWFEPLAEAGQIRRTAIDKQEAT